MYSGICPPNTVFNPITLHCIKLSGRKARELIKAGKIPAPKNRTQRSIQRPTQQPATQRLTQPQRLTTQRLTQRLTQPVTQQRLTQPVTQPQRTTRKTLAKLPVGSARVIPIGERPILLSWIKKHCTTGFDAITNQSFADIQSEEELQQLVRLHTGTCVLAPNLHAYVRPIHKRGDFATVPGIKEHMTRDDFKVLRAAMRRQNPEYKLPGRKHRPPPDEWALYVGTDERSGLNFASVMYVDITQLRRSAGGTARFEPSAVKLNLGFIPQLEGFYEVIELLRQLNEQYKMLKPVPGGWRPIAGFPFTKRFWEEDGPRKFAHLIKELTDALNEP